MRPAAEAPECPPVNALLERCSARALTVCLWLASLHRAGVQAAAPRAMQALNCSGALLGKWAKYTQLHIKDPLHPAWISPSAVRGRTASPSQRTHCARKHVSSVHSCSHKRLCPWTMPHSLLERPCTLPVLTACEQRHCVHHAGSAMLDEWMMMGQGKGEMLPSRV
eukprot:scaffold13789_cov19-Tisochrysis_lutea.AAC.2